MDDLRELMRRTGLSASSLARLIGRSPQGVQQWMRKKARVRVPAKKAEWLRRLDQHFVNDPPPRD